MQTSNQVALGVLADDFTGALDSGVELVRAGFSAQFQIQPSTECSADVLIVSSESRNRLAAEARMRVAEAVARLQGRRLFKKIDSTMRGHVGAEIEVVLAAT
ncbi:MAG TPA: four-carbon acid sugar kinase family protein, partial [Roseiflexaceae bacterium]|nr:four-carbon acid sugar kinase family protein [Roseiflexaceae bacterium]